MFSRKIEYFITLAECLSFTQTAARHDVSQTAISQYIAGLEERLGVRLFERSQRSVALTEAGRYWYDRVSRSMRAYDEALMHLKAISAHYRGCLRVGVGMYEYCSTEGFFSGFLMRHPEIRLDILQYPYSTLIEKLKLGELDVIIGYGHCLQAFSPKEIRARTLFTSSNDLVAAPELATRHGSPEELLRRECLITNCEDSGPSSMTMLHGMLRREYGFVPELIAQTNTVAAQLMMVRAGHGIAIVPGFVVEKQAPELTRYALPSGEQIEYVLIMLSDSPNPAAALMLEFDPKA